MCGRFLLVSPVELIRRAFGVAGPAPNLAARWNVAPTTACLVLRRGEEGASPAFAMLRWGLVPPWARDMSGAARMINARGETVAAKPAFREALRRRRCLVPADGFYEWPEEGEDRRPVLFRRADRAPFAFAAIWEAWRAPDGATTETFAIVNTEARGAMRRFHHRVPIVLDGDALAAWLDPASDPAPFVAGPAFEEFEPTRVGTHVNSVRNDDPRCAEPAPAEPPPPPSPSPPARAAQPVDARQGKLF